MTEKQFIEKWVEKIENDLLTKFPDDYIKELETEKFVLPARSFSITSELFGQYELLDIDGNIVIQTEDHAMVKYLLYANRSKPSMVLVPASDEDIKIIVKAHEKILDSIIKEVMENVKVVLPNSDPLRLSNQIFNLINLKRY